MHTSYTYLASSRNILFTASSPFHTFACFVCGSFSWNGCVWNSHKNAWLGRKKNKLLNLDLLWIPQHKRCNINSRNWPIFLLMIKDTFCHSFFSWGEFSDLSSSVLPSAVQFNVDLISLIGEHVRNKAVEASASDEGKSKCTMVKDQIANVGDKAWMGAAEAKSESTQSCLKNPFSIQVWRFIRFADQIKDSHWFRAGGHRPVSSKVGHRILCPPLTKYG